MTKNDVYKILDIVSEDFIKAYRDGKDTLTFTTGAVLAIKYIKAELEAIKE